MPHKICLNCHDDLEKTLDKKSKKKSDKQTNKSRDINLDFAANNGNKEQDIKKKIEMETKNLQKEFNEMTKKEISCENNSYGETEEIICIKEENNNENNNKKIKQNNNKKSIYDIKDATCSVICKYSNYFLIGSGFLVKRNKVYYVITCAHIVSDEPENEDKKIYIDLQNVNGVKNNHQQIICEIVGLDKAADIAVLRPLSKQENNNEGYNINNQKFVKFGNSTKTLPGTECYIIGNAYGTDPFSIANGVIRDNKFVFDLQTESMLISAPTWAGNSGSPIFNDEYCVIGMVSYSFRNEDDYESTLVGGSTQFMLENITRLIIDAYDDNVKGFIGIKKFVTMSDVILIVMRQMFPDFSIGNKDRLKGLLILDLDENIKSTEKIKKLDILLEITNPITKEKINLGCLDGQYHFSRISWFQRIGFPIEAKLLRPLDNTSYNTVFTVYQMPEKYDDLFGDTNSLNKNANVGFKNYTIKSLASKVKTRDLFDFI
jgi:S1-C subfamily serine protease